MNKSYYIDRVHKKILYSQEFEHHGIEGQRWGVITRNVGVNYIPVWRAVASKNNSNILYSANKASSIMKGDAKMNKEEKVYKFLRDVRKMAEENGIEHLFVIAENHSVTNNDGSNEAIRRCRETLRAYEKEIGSDPDEHWT